MTDVELAARPYGANNIGTKEGGETATTGDMLDEVTREEVEAQQAVALPGRDLMAVVSLLGLSLVGTSGISLNVLGLATAQ